MNILLFGGGLQVLAIARSLKEIGYIIDVVGDDNKISKKSRFVHQCIDVKINTLSVDSFIQLVNKNLYSVIIPMEDDYSSWLSTNKYIIESQTKTKCAIADYEIYSLVCDKSRLLEFCRTHNIPHPRTALIRSTNYKEVTDYVGFPALIKPNKSAGSRGIQIVNNLSELYIKHPINLKEYGESTLQEYIENDHYYNVMIYRCIDGTFSNYTITKITRFYPIKGGSSSFCTTIYQDRLLNICKDLLDKLNWIGFADFDVLEKDNGDFRVIEINPRVPASIRAASISGINFGEIIVRGTLGQNIPEYKYTPNKSLRCLGLDIAWFLSSPKRWKATPSWFKFIGKDLYYQEGGKKEWIAMLTSLYIGVGKMLSPSFRKKKKGMN